MLLPSCMDELDSELITQRSANSIGHSSHKPSYESSLSVITFYPTKSFLTCSNPVYAIRMTHNSSIRSFTVYAIADPRSNQLN